MEPDPLPHDETPPGSTARKLDDAIHFKRMVSGYATFLDAAKRTSDEGTEGDRYNEFVRDTYEELCKIVASAERQTGNREPEMAEVLEELLRLRDEYREILN